LLLSGSNAAIPAIRIASRNQLADILTDHAFAAWFPGFPFAKKTQAIIAFSTDLVSFHVESLRILSIISVTDPLTSCGSSVVMLALQILRFIVFLNLKITPM